MLPAPMMPMRNGLACELALDWAVACDPAPSPAATPRTAANEAIRR
jgi:hypothetical protein